jgi:hypothetical protein
MDTSKFHALSLALMRDHLLMEQMKILEMMRRK